MKVGMRRRQLSPALRRAMWRSLRRCAIAAPIALGCVLLATYRAAVNGGEGDGWDALALVGSLAVDATMIPPFVRAMHIAWAELRDGAPCPE